MRSLILASAIMLPLASGAAADSRSAIADEPATGPAPIISGNSLADSRQAMVIDPVRGDCPSLAERAAEKRGRPLSADRLTDLPPGEAFHAVYRLDSNGCPDPVLVGYQNRDGR